MLSAQSDSLGNCKNCDVPHRLGAGVGELVGHRRHEERSGGAEATSRRRRPLPLLSVMGSLSYFSLPEIFTYSIRSNRILTGKNFQKLNPVSWGESLSNNNKVIILRNADNPRLVVLLLLRTPVQFGVEGLELLIIPLLKKQ